MTQTPRFLPTILALLAGLILALAADGPVAAADGPLPRFETATCPLPAPEGVRCGYLVVPEDRGRPDGAHDPSGRGGTIRLAVAILPSHSAEPAPDPVVYLEGGPGGSALEGLDHWLDSPLRDRRDLILFEQRGTRYSEPWLDCPELKETYVDNWVQGLDDEQATARELEAGRICRDRLRAEGVDLAAYHSAASAADLADLRQALGYDQWNLYGISYGTRLALTVLRDQPEGIRSVIIDSVYPPAVDGLVELAPGTARVLDKLFADCAADPTCRAAYPDLEAGLYRLLAEADAQPIPIDVRHPDSGELLRLPLDGEAIVDELFIAFYDSALLPFLPLVIDQAGRGNHGVLLPLTDFTLGIYLSGSEAMNISVNCNEEVPFNSLPAIAAAAAPVPPPLRTFYLTGTLELCDLWDTGPLNPVEDEPVHSDIPTLVMEGEYDPITPPAFGQLAAETLPNSFYFQFPGLGHGVTSEECPMSIVLAFLDDPGVEPEAGCLAGMANPTFVTGRDLYLTPAPYRLLIEFNAEASALPYIILAFCDLFYLSLVLVGAWALLRLLRAWPGPLPRGDGLFHLLLAAIALLNLLFVAGLAGLIVGTLFGDWSLVIFGLPPLGRLLLLLPLLSALLTLAWAGWLAVAWLRGHWSAARRLLYSLLALGLLAFLWLLAYWDLLPIRL